METKHVTSHDLTALLKAPSAICASIYLEIDRSNNGLLKPPIYLKNSATAIEERLTNQGRRTSEARDFVAPLRELAGDECFWRAQGPGVALFLSEQGLFGYRLRSAPVNECSVGERFRVLPLLSPAESDDAYRVLAVSANAVTLYEGSREGLKPIPVEHLPHGLVEALNLDQPQALVQVMSMPFGSTTFHGQGGEIDRRKGELSEYFHLIDRALHPYLVESQLPLLFAGVEYLFPIYRGANTYPHLLETRLAGNPERMDAAELHHRAEELFVPYRRRMRDADAARYDAVGRQRTTERLSVVLAEAHAGAVEVLFLAEHENQWGRYDATAATLDLTYADDPAGCELFDLAACQTLIHGGRVHVVPTGEVPHGGTCAALLRFVRPAQTPAEVVR